MHFNAIEKQVTLSIIRDALEVSRTLATGPEFAALSGVMLPVIARLELESDENVSTPTTAGYEPVLRWRFMPDEADPLVPNNEREERPEVSYLNQLADDFCEAIDAALPSNEPKIVSARKPRAKRTPKHFDTLHGAAVAIAATDGSWQEIMDTTGWPMGKVRVFVRDYKDYIDAFRLLKPGDERMAYLAKHFGVGVGK